MLNSIIHTTLHDDVLRADAITNHLEHTLSALLSQPSALLVLSGTMGNQLAIASHFSSLPYGILTDSRSHIINHEAGGMSSLSSAFPQPVTPSNGKYLTLSDIKKVAVLPESEDQDEHQIPTRLIVLENTLGGSILPVSVVEEISAWAKEKGIKLHLDGARLWDAVTSLAGRGEFSGDLTTGMQTYGRLFDSVTVCFSKGLGAPIGSGLVGPERFIRRARHIRKSIGGGMRQTGIIAAPALVGIQETFFGGKLARGHGVARRISEMWTQRGGKLQRDVETNMVWLDLEAAGVAEEEWMRIGEREGVKVWDGRVVGHYQVCEQAIEAFGRVMDAVLKDRKHVTGKRKAEESDAGESSKKAKMEDTELTTNGNQKGGFKGYANVSTNKLD